MFRAFLVFVCSGLNRMRRASRSTCDAFREIQHAAEAGTSERDVLRNALQSILSFIATSAEETRAEDARIGGFHN
jgi:hypothetical protein